MTKEAIATPSSAIIGTKYVAAEKPNGAVDGKLSSGAPGLPRGKTMSAE